MLVSAGFAAIYPTTPLDGLAIAPVSRAVDLLLAQQEPYGAVVIDRCWNVIRVNDGGRRLLATFLHPSAVPASIASNLVHATLHPEGLRPHIVNGSEVVAIMLERVERAHHADPADPADQGRRTLLEEIRAYPEVARLAQHVPLGTGPVAVLHLRRGADELRLFTLLTTIGTPIDVTAQELTIESFFPADEAIEHWFQQRGSVDA